MRVCERGTGVLHKLLAVCHSVEEGGARAGCGGVRMGGGLVG